MTPCSQLQAPHRFWIAVRSLHSPAWRLPWRTPLDGAVLRGSMWWHPYHTDSWTSFQEVLTCSPSSPGDSSSPLSLPSPTWVSLIQIQRRRRGRGGKKPENSAIELTQHKKVEETKSKRGGRRAMRTWSKACNTPTVREEGERERERTGERESVFPSRPRSEPRSGPRSIWH